MNNSKTLKRGFLKGGSTMQFFSRNLPVFYFLFALGMFNITMSLASERKGRSIDYLKKDIKELRWEYMTLKSELMYSSTYTQVAQKAFGKEAKEMDSAPKKILVGYRP